MFLARRSQNDKIFDRSIACKLTIKLVVFSRSPFTFCFVQNWVPFIPRVRCGRFKVSVVKIMRIMFECKDELKSGVFDCDFMRRIELWEPDKTFVVNQETWVRVKKVKLLMTSHFNLRMNEKFCMCSRYINSSTSQPSPSPYFHLIIQPRW